MQAKQLQQQAFHPLRQVYEYECPADFVVLGLRQGTLPQVPLLGDLDQDLEGKFRRAMRWRQKEG